MLILVIVGRSGAGKSTSIEAMGFSKYHCVLSKPMIEELERRGLSVNHDNIHALAKEWYAANRWWQIEYVLEQLEDKSFLILDGLRYAFELEHLRKLFPDNVIVVKIVSTPKTRFRRLKERGKVPLSSFAEFKRLEEDESHDMDLEEILAAADFSIENCGSLDELTAKAEKFSLLLKPFVVCLSS